MSRDHSGTDPELDQAITPGKLLMDQLFRLTGIIVAVRAACDEMKNWGDAGQYAARHVLAVLDDSPPIAPATNLSEPEAKAVIFETIANPSSHTHDEVSAACCALARYLPATPTDTEKEASHDH